MAPISAPKATSYTSLNPSSCKAALIFLGVILSPNWPTNAGAISATISPPSGKCTHQAGRSGICQKLLRTGSLPYTYHRIHICHCRSLHVPSCRLPMAPTPQACLTRTLFLGNRIIRTGRFALSAFDTFLLINIGVSVHHGNRASRTDLHDTGCARHPRHILLTSYPLSSHALTC